MTSNESNDRNGLCIMCKQQDIRKLDEIITLTKRGNKCSINISVYDCYFERFM